MTFFGIAGSITLLLALLSGSIYLIEHTTKEIWEVEEFTGSFWKALTFLKKLFISLAVLCLIITIFEGVIYIIILLFRNGIFRG